ncbi:hypothetical protein AMATHDRAFT_139314 [Amanita thiersii Skay4041]|uniref:Sister chromatid cohesion protein DCC1 n=1 Tax=Amanita thiersii Skay4041 TaxID=703135 RepID=A0A2A9NQG1_9AGAR|nr:hypothetical protein AMATHDRAFT_139314 [Amanita thiersii Skay4041]
MTLQISLKFSPNSLVESGSYRLVELPVDLCNVIEPALNASDPLHLCIKGQRDEDAVLCTQDKTYSLRSVVLSNTILIVTPSPDDESTSVDIRDQVTNILELAPCVPKLQKLDSLLKGRVYDEGCIDVDDQVVGNKVTYDDARSSVQASDSELALALENRRILMINGELRPIAPSYLHHILELLLNLLVSLSLSHDAVSINELGLTLAEQHDVPQAVTTQVMAWFGTIDGDKCRLDLTAIVREIGLDILRNHRHEPVDQDTLLAKWRSGVGDSYESRLSLELLLGNYVTLHPSISSAAPVMKYFPASELPIEPQTRFADLFLARSRWTHEEITPFLTDIAVDTKERDKLILKYCRAITEEGTTWYMARTQYNG